jgi:hypothetical protein
MMNEIPEHISATLLHGIIYAHDRDGDALDFPTRPDLDKLWRQIGPSLTADYAAQHPGARPWAWWQWSIPTGVPCPFGWTLTERAQLGGVASRLRERPADYQQREYLNAHGLLTPDEQSALAAEDARWARK